MVIIFSSNDPTEIAFAQSLLSGLGITPYLNNVYTANIEGNMGIFPQQIMVTSDEAERAIIALKDNGLIGHDE